MTWLSDSLYWLVHHPGVVALFIILLFGLSKTFPLRIWRRVFSFKILSIVLAAIFIFLAIKATDNPGFQSVLAGIASCFVFAITIEGVQSFYKWIDKKEFRAFFGEDAVHDQMSLVYPDFVLAQEVKDVLSANKINPQLVFQKTASNFPHTHRVDIPNAVADNDLQAMVYIAGLFGDLGQKTPAIKVDFEVVKHFDESFISVGLSSNDCTHMYMERCGQQLFKIVADGKGSEYLELIKFDDKGAVAKTERYVSDFEKYNFGLIIRFHPCPEEKPNRVWIFCAGLGPHGTKGAAWFLAEKWQSLHRQVGTKDFAAVVKVPVWSDEATSLGPDDIYFPPTCDYNVGVDKFVSPAKAIDHG